MTIPPDLPLRRAARSRTRTAPGLRWAVLLLAFASNLAFAALDAAPSDLGDSGGQRTAATTASGAAYTDIRHALPSGTVVHEYADASGQVFAVSWAGPFKPDLKLLLGRHFDRLATGAAAQRGERSRLDVETGTLVIQSGGHMGAFEGRAWLPARLPAGFDPRAMR
ncbi:MAG: DUF2844 domain-containing protein [Burkholderiales bacterium]|nr:DUF2844 domain-containing protein [Burkholderiales bacterium]